MRSFSWILTFTTLIVSDARTFKTSRLPVDVVTKICMAANEEMVLPVNVLTKVGKV
jgi:hypothetical protein